MVMLDSFINIISDNLHIWFFYLMLILFGSFVYFQNTLLSQLFDF
jgi:hypothetical protein